MTGNALRRAIVAGASSGVGEATARALGRAGFDLVLLARRAERLRDVARDVKGAGGRVLAIPADLSDPWTAAGAMDTALRHLGGAEALVCCLGTNVPNRRLDVLSASDWDRVLAVNLSAVFYCVRTVLPAMRTQGHGAVVMISSIAGPWPSALSGAAYSASKAGMNALSRCINLEEGPAGIRSCVIMPGDIDTELLERRPEPPAAAARESMLRPEDVAELVVLVLTRSDRAWVDELVIRPRREDGTP